MRSMSPPLSKTRAKFLACMEFSLKRCEAQSFLNRIPATHAWQILRSWSHSWITSWRMHEVPRSVCIFGCVGESDSESHYLCCPFIWVNISHVTGCRPGYSVFERLALNQSSGDLLNLCVVCHAYHVIRSNSLVAVRSNLAAGRSGDNFSLWRRAAVGAFARYREVP